MANRKVLSWWPLLLLPLLICITGFPARAIADSNPSPCPEGQVYLNGVCSSPAPGVSLCPNAPIRPTEVTPSNPPCPNAPVSPTEVLPSNPPCPNAPVSPIVVTPSNPPCPNPPTSPTVCASSYVTTCTTNCAPNCPTSCSPSCNNNCNNPPCPNNPLTNYPCPNNPPANYPCPNNPPVNNPPANNPPANNPSTNYPCTNNPPTNYPCPNNPAPNYPCPNYPPPSNPDSNSSTPQPLPTPPTYPPLPLPPTYPPLPPPPTYPPLPPLPTYPPLPPPPTYPPLPPLPTYPPWPTTTTPPPDNIVEIRCPEGTILVKNRCRLVYCGGYGVYARGRCTQARCPPGFVWTGHRCSIPQPTELGNIHLESTVYQKAGNLPHLITNNVNNVEVNASIAIPGQASEEEYEDVEVVVPQPPTGPCCQVVAPRTCTAQASQTYRCFSRSQQQCGNFCSANRVVLVPMEVSTWMTQANNQMMVIPPNWAGQSCQSTGGVCQQANNFYDCSGCAAGDSLTCSSYCYSYKCSSHNCAFYDQAQYCAQYPGQVGCRPSEGWFPTA